MYSLDELKLYVNGCRKCELSNTRNNIVFGQGDPNADIMFIGEAPGRNEDLEGKVFIGPAGQLFTKAIEGIGLKREDVYITNIIKCRPPGNRDPRPEEMEKCIEYLRWQVKIIKPKIIVCLGRIASVNIIDKNIKITRERGIWKNKKDIWILPTFHPSAILRDEMKKKPFWNDFKAIREKYDIILKG